MLASSFQRSLRQCCRAKTIANLPVRCDKAFTNRVFSSDVKGSIPIDGIGVEVGQYAMVERSFSAEQVLQFGNLIHDLNPLHLTWQEETLPLELQTHPLLLQQEKQEGPSSSLPRPIVHGMLVSSLFSSIFGTLVPGAVYMNQTLNFSAPVFVDDLVVGRVDITRVRNFKAGGVVVTCDTRVLRKETECVSGKANVWLPGASKKTPAS
ncbi:Peroxisomal [Seminavis robusta]|uniref:Peroxisomal n=1 Tax=Seminavis robusta TaxID=568900 RepID=A0A9N8HBT8_9STRA|nr:Peroxisomal [Seminavis robusta]|eukprot:Sro352_g124110.1 Peroxisomal (208) ;mRNA; f:9462-10190